MACRGVHFALTNEQHEELLSQPDDASRRDYVAEKVEAGWDARFLQETDKAWDAIHRCITGPQNASPGELDPKAGTYPLNQCILGGRSLYEGKDYIITLIEPGAVRDLAAALQPIECAWMKRAYVKHCKDAWPEYGVEDCIYTWECFSALKEFFVRMAPTGRAVIFTADQ